MKFEHWGLVHILLLFITLLGSVGIPYLAKRFYSATGRHQIGIFLGSVLLLNYLIYVIYRVEGGYWQLRYDLPMEFCNWAAVVTSFALFTKNRTLAELSYFWVMAGSLQGVLTPDLSVSFPHIYFFIFFIAHSGLVISSMYLVLGMGLTPRKGAVLRAILYSQIFVIAALCVDFLLDANYGYMRYKPDSGSALDFLGPWPIYLLWLEALGAISFALLYLPFYFKNRRTT